MHDKNSKKFGLYDAMSNSELPNVKLSNDKLSKTKLSNNQFVDLLTYRIYKLSKR
jgi:hypothetical protein